MCKCGNVHCDHAFTSVHTGPYQRIGLGLMYATLVIEAIAWYVAESGVQPLVGIYHYGVVEGDRKPSYRQTVFMMAFLRALQMVIEPAPSFLG